MFDMFDSNLSRSTLAGEKKIGWLVSAALHAVAVALMLLARQAVPAVLDDAVELQRVTLLTPPPPQRQLARVHPPPTVRRTPEPPVWEPARPSRQPKAPARRPLPLKAVPKIEPLPQPANIPAPSPKVPQPPAVRTDDFVNAHTGSPTTRKSGPTVSEAGFGSPTVSSAQPLRANLEINVGSFGSARPAPSNGQTSRRSRDAPPSSTAFGDLLRPAPDNSVRSIAGLQTGAFDSLESDPPPAREAPAVRAVSFGEAVQPAPVLREKPKPIPAGFDRGVEIVSKPRPAYTEEARRLGVEGDVVLEVLFTAKGEVHVKRLVSGLGHGLDERAVEAALRIGFLPARREGKPVDLLGTVRIQFRLA